MTKKQFKWSYSALSMFHLCPKKWAETRWYQYVDDSHAANKAGVSDHAYVEKAILEGRPLPPHLQPAKPVLDSLRDLKGITTLEHRLCVNRNMEPTDWFSKDGYGRAVVDFLARNKDKAITIDWKFGKWRSEDRFLQLKVGALMVFKHFPKLHEITGGFVWFKQSDKFEPFDVTRDDLPNLEFEVLNKVNEVETSIKRDSFPAQPNFLCGKYCMVFNCKHNGRGGNNNDKISSKQARR